MKAVFADTFHYLALVDRDANQRRQAERISRDLSSQVVTTAWVLTEVANALAEPPFRAICRRMFAVLRSDPGTTIVPASADLFDRGWDFYARREDKSWSLTDCISFVVMRQEKIDHALTGDHHFEQARFTAMLKSD
jgi:predicted nucleic acid-binding protein